MRILRIHNRYQQRGGEDVSFEQESQLLRDQGHFVEQVEFSSDDIPSDLGLADRIRLAGSTIWSRSARHRIATVIAAVRPDIAHFDNTLPLVSPASYEVCKRAGVAVVQSLHNYRLLCPAATFYRGGQNCQDCMAKPLPIPGVVHGCYRGSRSQTATVAAMLGVHRLLGTWRNHVDQYIALTEFARKQFVEGGLSASRIAIKPNFVHPPAKRVALSTETPFCLYVGRLTAEKGIPTMLEAWRSNPQNGKLVIVGDGPLAATVWEASRSSDQIAYLGRQPEAEAYRLMAAASFVLVPSEWYEPFGRVVIESYANGTPVIATRSGGLAELVEDGKTGFLFRAGDPSDLTSKLRWARCHPRLVREMGGNAVREFEAKYTPDRNYRLLMDIYQQALDHAEGLAHNNHDLSTKVL